MTFVAAVGRPRRPPAGHRDADRQPVERRPRVPPPGRRADPRGRRHPADRHLDLHGRRALRGSTSSGAPRRSSPRCTASAGWTGLVILRAALVGLLFGLLFLACRLRGADIRRAAWLTLAAFLISAVALALRPQLFGMVLLAATLVHRRRPPPLAAAPVARAAHRRRLGEPPRQLLPRSGRRRSGLARGSPRPAAGRVADARRRRRRGRSPPSSTRSASRSGATPSACRRTAR